MGDAGGADITVELQAGNGSTVNFQTDAFNEACVKETGANLNFDYDSGRGGYLYYQHGESGESEVGSGRYYRASSPRLDQVSFVPGSGTGSSVRIPFEGEATNGKSFYGEVKLTYVTLSEPTIITYTSTGLAVDFNAADFTAACAARGGKALTSVRFPAPDTTGGQLYYNFHTPTQYRGEVVSTVDYSVGGVYLLGEVTFLPKAGYSGVVTIPYVGTDADGIEYTGTVQVMVTPSASSRFSDMGSYNSWAGASVEFLAAYGITTGTGDGATFSPASTLTRGDYILMLYRTFGFSSTAAAGNFTDVAAGSYYAEALAHAKALGIATAEADGSFRPNDPVTRQDAMVFLLRAMQAVNRSVPNAYDSYLSRFPDGASVADYARTAMAAMAQAAHAPRVICLINKSDRPLAFAPEELRSRFPHLCVVSAATGAGLDALGETVAALFPAGGAESAGELLTNARQADAARRALEAVTRASESLEAGITPDALLTDAEEALAALGELTGASVREDVTARIFERFCVGK